MKKFKTIRTVSMIKNPWWEYRFDKYSLPNGDIGDYHYVFTHGSTFVIPVLNDGKILMTKQYRYLNQKFSIEFPGGGLPKGIAPEENAKKELQEETGFVCNKIELLGVFNPYNGVTPEICTVFVASDLKLSDKNLDETEEIENLTLSKEKIASLISNDEIWDGMTLAAWTLFVNKKMRN